MRALHHVKAAKPSGPWRPGGNVIDETCDRLGVDLVRRLLESSAVLHEDERWVPTRWLMKAAWEAVHGRESAFAAIVPGVRSGSEYEGYIIDLYRKLSGDFGSAADEVVGTGERAHGRCNRSYVFSSQLRHWLHEVPPFVQVPTGWQPPPEPAAGGAPPPLAVDDKPAYMQTYEERARGRMAGRPDGPDFGPPPEYIPPPPRALTPRHASPSRGAYSPGTGARPASARAASPSRLSVVRGRSPARGRPQWQPGGGYELPGRPERLLAALAGGIRKRLYDDLQRPHDLFRAWCAPRRMLPRRPPVSRAAHSERTRAAHRAPRAA